MSDDLQAAIASTREELEQFLRRPELDEVAQYAARSGLKESEIFPVLDQVVQSNSVPAKLIGIHPLLGRWMLAHAALESLDRILELPVVPEVKLLICKDYQSYCNISAENDVQFLPQARGFYQMATVARLGRYIAGQVHWQISGIPRSWMLQMRWRDAARTLATVFGMGGFAPCFEAHIPTRDSPFLLEREYKRCYVRIARSMELQPGILGIMGASWMYAEETMKISPHLAWLDRLFLENGGILAHMGPAKKDAGFLVGSPKRRELYESGAYRPRTALFIWPRSALLDWARRQ